MSRILRIFAYFCLICFTSNVFAAGYTCPSYQKYTSCKSGYFMSAGRTGGSGTSVYYVPNSTSAAGNMCVACASAESYSSAVTTCPGGTSYPRYKVGIFFEGVTSYAYRSADNTTGLYSNATAAKVATDWTTLWVEKNNHSAFYDFAGIYSAANGAGTQYVNADGTVTTNFASFASAKSTTAPTIYPYYTAKKTTCDAGKYLKCTASNDCLCTACPAGKYCAGGEYEHQNKTVNIGITGDVAAGYYSTGGASTSTPTAAGNGCLSGYSCGLVAEGYYSTGGATSSTGNGAVAAGYYSTGGGKSATPTSSDCISGKKCGRVYSGYYSTGGGTSATPTAAGNGCLSGYQCGKCAGGTYSEVGASSCTACPTGWTSDAGAGSEIDCFKTFRLNKNGASFAADAWSSLGLDNMRHPSFADVISNVSGTANATVKVWYHADKGYTSYLGIPDARTEPSGYALTGGVGTSSTCTTGPTQTDWMDGASFMYDIRSLTNSLSSGTTLYLCRSASTFAVNYAAGNGSGTAPTSPTACAVGGTCSAPSNTYTAPTGYEFSGWKCTGGNTSCDGDIIQAGTNMANFAAAGGSITLTAQWTAKIYSITISKNGGTGVLIVGKTSTTGTTDAVISCTHGSTFDVSMLPAWGGANGNSLTKNNYVFTGWSQTSNFTCTANKTITAVWGQGTCSKGTGVDTTNLVVIDKNAPVCSVSCSAGYYYSSTSRTGTAGVASLTVTCNSCGNGTYSAAGATSCTSCPIGTYSAKSSASTGCTACPAGRTTSGTGTAYNATATTACSVTCSNSSNVSNWLTPGWTAANGATNVCKIDTCSTKYILSGDACTACTYTANSNVSAVTVTGSSNNTCSYSYTCNAGYHVNGTTNGTTNGTATGSAGSPQNRVGDCAANSYTISFYSNGAAGTLPNKPMLYGEEYTLPGVAFSYTGYDMTGWKCTGGGSSCDGDVYGLTDVVSNLTTDYNDTVSMTAQWTPKGNIKCDAGKYLPAGSVNCASCPAGYYCDGTGSFTFSTVQNQGLSLCTSGYSTGGASKCSACNTGYSATGTGAEYHDEESDCKATITLNKNGGSGLISLDGKVYSGTTSAEVICSQGVSCTFPGTDTLTQNGYTFNGGWGTSNKCSSDTTTFTNNPYGTYYACKTVTTYSITYQLNGGTLSITPTSQYNITSAPITLPTAAQISRANSTFAGWYDNADFTGSAVTQLLTGSYGNKTYYAKWRCNDGYTASGTSCTANKTGTITLDSKYYSSTSATGATVTPTALPLSVYIQYNTGVYDSTNAKITKLTRVPSKTGYTFMGFYTGKAGTGTKMINADGTFTADALTQYPTAGTTATWYAHYSAGSYQVSFSSSRPAGSSTTVTGEMSSEWFVCDQAQKLPKNSYKLDGYTFLGWSTSPTATTATYEDEQSVTNVGNQCGNITLYPVWSPNTITIDYDENGGTSVSNTTCTFDGTFTLPSSAPTRTGYTFKTWKFTPGGALKGGSVDCNYATLGVYSGTAKVTAQWTPITYTVKFVTGSTVLAEQSFTYDSAQNLTKLSDMTNVPAALTGNGWQFVGWTTSTSTTGTPMAAYIDGVSAINLTATSGGTVTLYGIWKRQVDFQYYANNTATTATKTSVDQYYRNTNATTAGVTSMTVPTAPSNSTTGWTMIGWKHNSSDADASAMTTTIVSPSASVAPVYNAVYQRTMTLEYDPNGGTPAQSYSPTTAIHYLNAIADGATTATFVLIDNPFAKTGFDFKGWRSDLVTYVPGNSLKLGKFKWTSPSTYTVYAVWSNGQFEFSLNPNGATSNGTTTLYTTYDTGVYLDSSRSKKMTTSVYPITKPQRSYTVTYSNKYGTHPTATSTYTFDGYTGAAVGSGIKTMITANGYITTDGENAAKVFDENKSNVWTAQWTSASVTLPSVTFPVGYVFGGWYTAETGGTRVGGAGESYTPTKSITLYARWVPKIYDILLDKNNGDTSMDVVYEKYETGWYSDAAATKSITNAPIPTYPMPSITDKNYVFIGYFTEDSDIIIDSDVSGSSDIRINKNGTLPSAANTFTGPDKLYARWAEPCIGEGNGIQCTMAVGLDGSVTYTATCPAGMLLSGNGTSRPSCGAQRVELVSSYTHDDGRSFDAKTQADPNVVYLIPNTGTVTQNTGFYSDVFGVNKITKLTKVPALESSCFAFQGFYTGQNGTGIQRIDKDGNILTNNYMLPEGDNPSLYADYIPTSFTLEYDAGTGTKDENLLYPNQVCFLTGNNSTSPCTLATPADKGMSKAGYTFAGWRCTGGGTSDCNGNIYPAGTDMRGKIADCTTATFTAQWKPINTTITLVKNNTGSNKATSGTNTLYAKYDHGLFADANYEQPMLTNAVGFTAPVKQFTVTFDDNIGGTRSANVDYEFMGYFSASTGGTKYTGKQYALDAGINAAKKYTTDQKWYAQWTSANVPLPSVTRTGYTFDGWYTAATGGTKVGDAGTPYIPTASVTLYAHWTACPYTVVFDANGGSGSMSSQTFYVDAAQNLTANTFTRVGAKFLGWATTKGATTAEYTDGQSVTNLATTCNADDVTLYAVWKNMVINGPQDQTKVYDGTPSTCNGNLSVTSPSGAKIKYATSQNGAYSATAPTITNVADSKTIYYQISATDYTTVSGNFKCTVTPATMPDMGADNEKVYDGTPLTCSGELDEDVPAGSTIEYATNSNGSYSTTAPTKTNVLESNVVYYRVTNPNYVTKTGSFECVIEKAANPITLSAYSGHVPYGRATTVSVTNAQGSLSVASSNTSVATATLSGTTVTMTGGSSYGTATITVSAAGNDNYLSRSQQYTLYVDQGIITLEPGAGTGGTTGINHQYNTNVWLNGIGGKVMTTTTNPITIPSRNGYGFAGYYADANSTTALIGANGFITSAGITAAKAAKSNITWVAKWTPNIITINYDSNGGTSVASTTCEYDNTFVLAAAPANSGKQFSNWSVNGGTYNAGATINCNHATLGVYSGTATIKANWGTCPAGSFCPTDGAPQPCPPNYPNSDVGATSSGNCYLTTSSGKYVATKNAAEVTCKSGGYYCSGDVRIYYGLTGGDSACDDLSGIEVPNGTYSTSPSTGASAPSACRYVAPSKTVTGCSTVTRNTVSYTGSTWNSNYYTVKASKGYHVGDNNVANPTCVVCGADKYQASDNSTATSCTSCLTNYHTYGDAAADHDAASDCQISCDGGSYLAKANNTTCSDVGAGYWAQSSMVAQGSAGSRTQCQNGWTTIGYGFGANEEADCGRIFNYGNQKIYLRSAKRDASQPALHVKIGDVIFYGTMKQVTGPQSGFNAEYDGKNYLIVNDDQ